jgi:hypothetical protein
VDPQNRIRRLFEYLRRLFSRRDDEPFVQLMSVAQGDASIRAQLISILAQDSFNRKSSLNTWIRTMQLQKAPASFVQAITYLLEDDTAEKALRLLSGDQVPDRTDKTANDQHPAGKN